MLPFKDGALTIGYFENFIKKLSYKIYFPVGEFRMTWKKKNFAAAIVCVIQHGRHIFVSSLLTSPQNKYSTKSPTPCRRLWCWCPRIFGCRHLPSKRAWKMFTLYQRCWCRFYEEKQFVVHFGTWTMNQNALWQLKSPQTKTRKTKTAW